MAQRTSALSRAPAINPRVPPHGTPARRVQVASLCRVQVTSHFLLGLAPAGRGGYEALPMSIITCEALPLERRGGGCAREVRLAGGGGGRPGPSHRAARGGLLPSQEETIYSITPSS